MSNVAEKFGQIIAEFESIYLGSVPVKEETGNDVVADAVARVRTLNQPERKVTLIVSGKGLFIVDKAKKEVVKEADIGDVSFVSMDANDKKLFSYITNQESLSLMMCHTFQVKQKAHEIVVAINAAFKLRAGQGDGSPKKMDKKAALAEATKEKRELRASKKKSSSDLDANILGTFNAKYLGSVHVAEPKGNHIILNALERITNLKQTPRAVEVVVRNSCIDVQDAKTKDLIRNVPIMEVSFTALDPATKGMFSFITSDSRLGLMYCHAFQVKGTSEAETIIKTINSGFELARVEAEKSTSAGIREISAGGASEKASGAAIGVFEAKYIGSVPVSDVKGDALAADATERAKALRLPGDGVVIVISSEGIRTVEGLTGEVLQSHFIKTISFTTVSDPRRGMFVYICKDDRLDRITCHVYECGVKAYDACSSIGEAFKAAHEEIKARNGNPFAAISEDEREAVQGGLFAKQIHRRNLIPKKPIGAGQFGQVFLAEMKRADGQDIVAVKLLRSGASPADKTEFLMEAETMLDLTHPNLVQMLGVAVQQRPWLCVIEYMQYGDVRAVLQTCKEKNVQLTLLEQLRLAVQICAGMRFMAENRYVHMDLAARNCLLNKGNVAKVADFGLTRKLDEGEDSYTLKASAKLPIKWMAIESLDQKIFSAGSDCWSYGVLLWEIMSYGETPYKEVANQEIQRRVREGLRLSQPAGADAELFSLALKCWHVNRHSRPSFDELHSVLQDMCVIAEKNCPQERDIGFTLTSMKK